VTVVRPEGFVQSYFEAWNRCDAEAIADHLAPEGTYHDVALNQELGRDALIANLNNNFAHERTRYELVGEALYGQSAIAFQYRVTSLDSNGTDIPGSAWYGAEFMTVNDEAALNIADYYEIAPDSERTPGSLPGGSPHSKYARSGLGEEQLNSYKEALLKLMEEDKEYLNSELTLPNLADLMDCSVNHLSQVINAGFGTSFYDFLNSYRIGDAKDILTADGDASLAILDIPFAVGFNTNSAFYSAFKKATGQTPAQYRRDQKKTAK
jgi:AraC-like DNA-binding protein